MQYIYIMTSIRFMVYDEKEEKDSIEKERILIIQSKGREYISDALISTILHYYSLSVLLTYTTKHFIVKTTIKCLLEMPIENWSFNRPPDQLRCAEISEYILNEKTVLDSVFYLVYNNKKGSFEVYDGSHRLSALKIAILLEAVGAIPLEAVGLYISGGARGVYPSNIEVN